MAVQAAYHNMAVEEVEAAKTRNETGSHPGSVEHDKLISGRGLVIF